MTGRCQTYLLEKNRLFAAITIMKANGRTRVSQQPLTVQLFGCSLADGNRNLSSDWWELPALNCWKRNSKRRFQNLRLNAARSGCAIPCIRKTNKTLYPNQGTTGCPL